MPPMPVRCPDTPRDVSNPRSEGWSRRSRRIGIGLPGESSPKKLPFRPLFPRRRRVPQCTEIVMRIPAKRSLAICAARAFGPRRPGLDAAGARDPPRPQRDAGPRPGHGDGLPDRQRFPPGGPAHPGLRGPVPRLGVHRRGPRRRGHPPGRPAGGVRGLVKSGEASGVYFLDGTTRRLVANPQVMDKYRFAWERVRDVTFEDLALAQGGDAAVRWSSVVNRRQGPNHPAPGELRP